MAADSRLSLDDLVARARSGDAEAYRSLVGRYQGRIYSLALRMLRRPEEAQDMLQDTFLSARRALPTCKGGSRFGAWLYRIATNCALLRIRGGQEVSATHAGMPGARIPEDRLAAFAADPVADATSGGFRGVMEDAISLLPVGKRIVFLLRDMEGLGNSEVAGILGLGVAEVKLELHDARLQLRRHLVLYVGERIASNPTRAPLAPERSRARLGQSVA